MKTPKRSEICGKILNFAENLHDGRVFCCFGCLPFTSLLGLWETLCTSQAFSKVAVLDLDLRLTGAEQEPRCPGAQTSTLQSVQKPGREVQAAMGSGNAWELAKALQLAKDGWPAQGPGADGRGQGARRA